MSDIDNPIAHLAHLPRPERRRQARAEAKAARLSPKHQVKVPAPGEYDGMPPETAADCLTGWKNTNTFRKTCKAARERIITPTATPNVGYPDRKIRECKFSQLVAMFNRSFAARFLHIPFALSKLNVDRVFVKRRRVIGDKAVKIVTDKRNAFMFAIQMHDEILQRVSLEINRRHAKHLGLKNV